MTSKPTTFLSVEITRIDISKMNHLDKCCRTYAITFENFDASGLDNLIFGSRFFSLKQVINVECFDLR